MLDIVVYTPNSVESTRTHENGIDLSIISPGSTKTRIFLNTQLAQELIHKMLTALATPYEKVEEEPIVK
jgi:hypothetical protein